MKWLGLVAAVLVAANGVHAQPRDVQKADALFREGRALMKSKNLDAACPTLEASYQLDPAAGTAVNLGDCFEQIGKIGSALLAYQAAEKLLAAGDPRIAPVKQQIAALQKRVPRLAITLPADAPEGAAVLRDGRAVQASTLGKSMVVNPGRVVVVVTAPGHEDGRSSLMLREGEVRHFVADVGDPVGDNTREVTPDKRKDTPALETDRVVDSNGSMKTAGYVVGGVGVGALTTGIITALMASAKDRTASSNCPDNKCNQIGYDAAQTGRTLNAVSYVGWGVGIAGVALGGYFLLSSPDETEARVGATASASGGNVTIKGRFW